MWYNIEGNIEKKNTIFDITLGVFASHIGNLERTDQQKSKN